MIKLTATSLVHSISQVMQVTERFSKRELVLNDSYTKDGQVYENFVKVEFTGDRMALLDNYAPGQRVQVEACINGRAGRDGTIFNTVRGLSIAPYQPQQAPAPAYQQPAQQGYAPAPAQPYAQQAAAYPQQGYQQAPQQYQQPAYPQQPHTQYGSPGMADLPFPH